MVGWSLATATHGLATGFRSLLLSRFLLGMGEGGGFPAATKAVSEWFPASERSTAMGIINAGTAVGAVVAPPARVMEHARTMHALVAPAYGTPDLLRYEEVTTPEVGHDEVLVQVRAASVCKGDTILLSGKPYLARLAFGLTRPKHRIAGQNVAGTVAALGKNVTGMKIGDEVDGQTFGAFAEQAAVTSDAIAPKPAGLTFEEAAAMPVSASTALEMVRAADVRSGQSVIIIGASGGVGMFAVQIAKALGAKVTAVCSTRHVARVREAGADDVVDYTKEDFAARCARHNAILDFVGDRALRDCQKALAPKGRYVYCGAARGNWIGPIVAMLKVVLFGLFASQTMKPGPVVFAKTHHLLALNALVEAGSLRPVIDRRFALRDAADAFRHVAEGHAQGTTVLSI
jgi:NADPH:quinone reductase-like Zn-dependent oxidoreductase